MRVPIRSIAAMTVGTIALAGSLAFWKPTRAADSQADPPAASGPTAGSSVTCARLTAAAASKVLNVTVTLVVDTSDGDGQSNCTYSITGGGTIRLYLVAGADAKQQFGMWKFGVTEPTAVPGIGDQAYDSDQGFAAIQGNYFVSVVGGKPRDPGARQRLAQAMLAALR